MFKFASSVFYQVVRVAIYLVHFQFFGMSEAFDKSLIRSKENEFFFINLDMDERPSTLTRAQGP